MLSHVGADAAIGSGSVALHPVGNKLQNLGRGSGLAGEHLKSQGLMFLAVLLYVRIADPLHQLFLVSKVIAGIIDQILEYGVKDFPVLSSRDGLVQLASQSKQSLVFGVDVLNADGIIGQPTDHGFPTISYRQFHAETVELFRVRLRN